MSTTSDDLTTDAIPSPPRDNVKPPNNEDDNCEEDNGGDNYSQKARFTPPRNFFKPANGKTNPASATYPQSIINITNAKGIHVGSNYNVYINNSQHKNPSQNINTDNKTTANDSIEETDAIRALFQDDSPVTQACIVLITPHMNEHWKDTARFLDYSDGQISQFYKNHIKTSIKEVIFQLLLDWKNNEPDEATVARLSTALWETNQKDVVLRWSQNFQKTK